MKEFWKYNLSELIMDVLLIIYSIFFSKLLFNDAAYFLTISPIIIYGFFLMVSLFMPWYMGVIYARYRTLYGKFFSAFPFMVMVLVVTVLFGIMTTYNEALMGHVEVNNRSKAVYYVSGALILFYIIRAWYIGYKTEKDILSGNAFSIEHEEHIRFFFISFALSAAFVLCMLYFAGEAPSFSHSLLYYFGVVFATFTGGLLWAYMIIKFMDRLQFLFPIVIISMLICWSGFFETCFTQAFELTGTKDYKDILIILLVFTGVIPFRIVMLLAPPLRGINLLLGIIALVCYFYSLGG